MLVVAFVIGSLLTGALTGLPSTPATAASGSQFQAGNIISDQSFYNKDALSVAQIQAFFLHIACRPRDGVPCLAGYTQTTSTKPAQGSGHCQRYDGVDNEPAAQIVWRVAQVCGISPAVLIVLMQKEQSLLTSPSAYGYLHTMGWGCPDSGTCDVNYNGFFNQVYKSAWQFRQYTLTASKWRYKVGDNAIQFSPTVACGSSVVRVQNQATANLYNYTPYQPNAAALNNLYGSGDGCSAYGNRNFWRMYSDWFGSPTDPPGTPIGEVKQIWTGPGTISFWGWVYDPDAPTASIAVHAKVGDRWFALTADAENSTSDALYPGSGSKHGFGATLDVSPGDQPVCLYGVNTGNGVNVLLGCWTLTVPDGSPIGEVKDLWGGVNSISAWGWAGDPDVQTAGLDVAVRVDGTSWYTWKANQPYPGLSGYLPDSPANHGFGGVIAAKPGPHEVCLFGVNQGKGSNSVLACRTISVSDGSPVGEAKDFTAYPGGVNVWGWAYDPDQPGQGGTVALRVDGTTWYTVKASGSYPSVVPFRDAAAPVGWGASIPLSAGRHEVCAMGQNVGAGASTLFRCATVTVPGGSPIGVVNQFWTSPGSISFWGWTLDPDTVSSIPVHVQIDQRWVATMADAPNAGVAASFPAYGERHGFGMTVPVEAGSHRVCIYGVNTGAGSNLTLWCNTVVVS